MKDEMFNVLTADINWGDREKEKDPDPKHSHWTDARIDRANNIIEGLFHVVCNLNEVVMEKVKDKPQEEWSEEDKTTVKESEQLVEILKCYLRDEVITNPETGEQEIHYTSKNRMMGELES